MQRMPKKRRCRCLRVARQSQASPTMWFVALQHQAIRCATLAGSDQPHNFLTDTWEQVGIVETAKKDDAVIVQLVAKKKSTGEVIMDTTKDGKGFLIKMGKGQMIQGLEDGIVGMKAGVRPEVTHPSMLPGKLRSCIAARHRTGSESCPLTLSLASASHGRSSGACRSRRAS